MERINCLLLLLSNWQAFKQTEGFKKSEIAEGNFDSGTNFKFHSDPIF
ncbi:hypothetical protein M5M_04492 [Simiduia agarivorans SA1 = DSM 21679]|uniref:Uncharacterized protein n=1 Tax=Simiduia agarivorans (strain DSM 21679 / JCM 13881 / BCRC 17597 / SA1) TaxID=1117647 RepID=R9S3A3_SIMAS|nr:hypothetical protein M5M_04492 [Simiduia agarivorans SA1 = DSM 21679]